MSASTSRTPVAQASGARTQVTGLVGAAAVALVVVLAPGLSRHLPSSVLAAVVIAAVLTIVDVPRIVRLARVDRREFGLAVLAFAGVAVLGVLRASWPPCRCRSPPSSPRPGDRTSPSSCGSTGARATTTGPGTRRAATSPGW